jgi:hypothetical protein
MVSLLDLAALRWEGYSRISNAISELPRAAVRSE